MGSISKDGFLEVKQSLHMDANNGDISAYRLLGDLYYQGFSGNDANHKKAFP